MPRACGLAIACVVLAAAPAIAQPAAQATVALLPLDAKAPLEIYGQPVASEIARALVAGGVDVVVVGPKTAVPPTARLIVDGSIRAAGNTVALQVRVRDPLDGTVLETLDAKAANVGMIDRAAAELSARVLPVVRERITRLAEPAPPRERPVEPRARVAPPEPTVVFSVAIAYELQPWGEPLRAALGEAVSGWVQDAGRRAVVLAPERLLATSAAVSVAEARAERAIAFEIVGYSYELVDAVPLARARVRVRIADRGGVVFERVVVTDTIVGDKGMQPERLATRVAREVLAILRPHVRRVEPRWR
jgi:hypothetical protein